MSTFTANLSAPGLHYLSALYPGSGTIRASVSPTILERAPLGNGDFALNLSSMSANLRAGQAGSLLVSVNSINGFSGDVVLSCSTGSVKLACGFDQSVIAKAHGGATLRLSAAANQAGALWREDEIEHGRGKTYAGLFAWGILAFLLLKFWPTRRRFSFAATCGLFLLVAWGCSNRQKGPADVSAANASYVVTVQATSSATNPASPLAHEVQVQVVVSGM